MLKLEKTTRLSVLTVRLREREGFFEPRLLKALLVALIFHVGAVLLFQVTPFFSSSTFIFSPIQVQSETPLPEVLVLASSDVEEKDELYPPSFMLIPALDWISPRQESALTPTLSFDPYAFQSIEERLWPKWREPLSLQLEEPSIRLAISGELATLQLMKTDPLLNQMQPISLQSVPTYVTYQVQLDEKTGEIFWYDRLESSGVAETDQITEKILLNLRFLPLASKAIVSGTLNFVVLEREKKVITASNRQRDD